MATHSWFLSEIDLSFWMEKQKKQKGSQQVSLVFTSCQCSHQLRNIVHAGLNVFLWNWVASWKWEQPGNKAAVSSLVQQRTSWNLSTKVYTFGRNVLFVCVVDYLFAVSLHVYMYVYTSCAQTQVLLFSQFLFAAVVVLCPDEILWYRTNH